MKASAGLRTGAWSAPEVDFVRRSFGRLPVGAIATRLRRSEASVRARARMIFRGRRQASSWEPGDDEALRVGFGLVPDADLALALRRTLRDVRERARQLRTHASHRAWTAADEARLKRIYGTRSVAALEVCLLRPGSDIEAAAARLCLQKDRRFLARARAAGRAPRWQPVDVERLRALYPTSDNLAVARALGRSVISVANKANQLGLRKRKRWLRQTGRQSAGRRWGKVQR